MTLRLGAALMILTAIGGCTNMKPADFKDAAPRLIIEDYFAGKTRAWGIFEDRFGRLRRQFTVDIDGAWDGRELVLDERFEYADGERDRRVWKIRKTGDHTYEGQADDVIGAARGEAYGNALNWRYDMDLKVGDGTLRVHFNDWMFLQPSGVLLNKATVTKLGLRIGSVTLAFMKPSAEKSEANANFSELVAAVSAAQAANQ